MKAEERDRKINDIHNVLMGVDGYPGMVQRFEELVKSHYSLKRLVYSALAFLAGSGVLGGGIWGIIYAIGKGG